jgi:cadmium resistance protein CadD (predicted permease)
MRSGIALTLVGVVVYFGIRQFIDEDMALFGLIPSAIGVANLVYAAVLWRRAKTP